jgi:3-oxoacyl-[acyl-carrier-protein] synthase-1
VSAPVLAVLGTGLVTPVGFSAPASCAAFRARIGNPTETRHTGSDGKRIMAHQVHFEGADDAPQGLAKLARMAAMAIDEALQPLPRTQWNALPLLLCVAERERPGRSEGLDDKLLPMISAELGLTFATGSAVVAHGRAGVAVALHGARKLIGEGRAGEVLVAATDSLLAGPTLGHYERAGRLLGEGNSNGFIPGEGAGALRVGPATGAGAGGGGTLVCTGIGFAKETATIDSDDPLRAEGLVQAIRAALAEAGRPLHEIDYRIADLSGEHYYFKEAALALQRTLRQRKDEFDLWHPAECTGEQGAASGISIVALAEAAAAKGYAKGARVLVHWANDAGQRSAAILETTSTRGA